MHLVSPAHVAAAPKARALGVKDVSALSSELLVCCLRVHRPVFQTSLIRRTYLQGYQRPFELATLRLCNMRAPNVAVTFIICLGLL